VNTTSLPVAPTSEIYLKAASTASAVTYCVTPSQSKGCTSGRAKGEGVLIVAASNRIRSGFQHLSRAVRVRQSLRQVDRTGFIAQPCHLPNGGFLKRSGAQGSRAMGELAIWAGCHCFSPYVRSEMVLCWEPTVPHRSGVHHQNIQDAIPDQGLWVLSQRALPDPLVLVRQKLADQWQG